MLRASLIVSFAVVCASTALAEPEHTHTTLIDDASLEALIAESSGELGLRHFERLVDFSGFAPSRGAEQTADYIAGLMRAHGLSDVRIDRFPSDGESFFWAFRSEPWWEAETGELWLVDEASGLDRERLASFDVHRAHLGQFSRSARLTSALVDVGAGTAPGDYAGKPVRGNVVLASGPPGPVHAMAVWEHGAAGAVVYRTADRIERPDLVSVPRTRPYRGPRGEPPGFVFALSYRAGSELAARLRREALRVRVEVDAETRAGHYLQVHATIPGSEPGLPEVWIQAHTDYRNTGGGNNLTGVGATIDLARTFAKLVADGTLARPRRNIHFVWGPEHMAMIYYLHENPQDVSRILAFLNLDMVGDHQVLSESVLRLYRTPHSLPSFLNDVMQEMFEVVAAGNSISLTRRRLLDFGTEFRLPILEPSGSRDPFYYYIEPFWGPSDHEDVAEGSLGVHAVLLNTWPDPYIGTQDDTAARADATQMKRAEVIAGAAAYAMASAGDAELPALAQNGLAKARARLAAEERRVMDIVTSASDAAFAAELALASTIVWRAHEREAEAIQTLARLASSQASSYVDERAREIRDALPRALERLESHMAAASEARGVSAEPRRAPSSKLVPIRTSLVRGPVNFFRAQYGRDFMTEKTGDPDFAAEIRLAARGHYYLYETLSFADGERTLSEIRDAVAAEYGPAPLDEIEEYFRLLERVGIVAFR